MDKSLYVYSFCGEFKTSFEICFETVVLIKACGTELLKQTYPQQSEVRAGKIAKLTVLSAQMKMFSKSDVTCHLPGSKSFAFKIICFSLEA